jgi:YD repeat-containing protein
MEQLMGLKSRLIIVLILFSAKASFSQASSLDKGNLKGKVKKITTVFYAEDLENGTGFNKHSIEEKWYNVKGNDSLVLLKLKMKDFKPKKSTYLYYSSGILELINHLNVKGNTVSIEKFEYDSLNRVIKKRISDMTRFTNEDTYYKYNLEGKIIEERINMDNSDKLFYSFSYKYENENVIELSSSLSSKVSTFKYNEHGDRVFEENTVAITLSEYEYDEYNNWIKRYDWIPKYSKKQIHPSVVRTIEYY